MIAITLLIACFQQGWFYTNQFTSLSLMVGWIAFVTFTSLRNISSNSYFIGQTLWLMPLTLTCVCIIQLFLSPVNVEAHIESIISFAFFTSFTFVIAKLTGFPSGLQWLQFAWYGVAAITVISALGSLYGLWDIPHVIWQRAYDTGAADARMVTRLAGVLQYPNTFGALMAIFVLERLMALSLLANKGVTQPSTVPFYKQVQLVLTLWAMTCLLLSGSRGAYLAMLIGWVIGFCILQPQSRTRYVGYTISLSIAAVLIVKPLIQTNLSPIPHIAIAHLLIITMAVLLLIYGGETYLRKLFCFIINTKYLKEIVCMTFILLLGIVTIGFVVITKEFPPIFNIDTWLARKIMYQDAWQLFQASPWWGYGGGTWRSAVYHIQQMAYVGKEVHSGYLDLLLNTGVIGFMILLIGLGIIAYSMITTRSPLLPAYSVLLLHAAIDFDLSYAIVWLLLFLLIGLHVAVITKAQFTENLYPTKPSHAISGNRMIKVKNSLALHKYQLAICRMANSMCKPSVTHALYGILCMILLISLGLGIRHTISIAIWNEAKHQPLEDQQSRLEDTLRWAGYQSEARIALAKQIPLEQAEALLLEGIHYDRLNFDLWLSLGEVQVARQEPKAVESLLQAVSLNPYSTALQEEVLSQLGGLSSVLTYNERQQAAVEVATRGYHLYLSYEQLVHTSLQQPAFKNDRQFELSSRSQLWGHRLAAKGLTE